MWEIDYCASVWTVKLQYGLGQVSVKDKMLIENLRTNHKKLHYRCN